MNFVFYKLGLNPGGTLADDILAGEMVADDIIGLNTSYATSIYHRQSMFDLTTFFQFHCEHGAECMYWANWYSHTILRIPIHNSISDESRMCFIGTYDITKIDTREIRIQ